MVRRVLPTSMVPLLCRSNSSVQNTRRVLTVSTDNVNGGYSAFITRA